MSFHSAFVFLEYIHILFELTHYSYNYCLELFIWTFLQIILNGGHYDEVSNL